MQHMSWMTPDVTVLRSVVLKGIPILLGEDSSEFFKTCSVLLESYDEEKDIIRRKGNAKASATRRTKAWQRIADRVNALVTRQKHDP
ncbi:unnamed protein product [Boreogadus saida]